MIQRRGFLAAVAALVATRMLPKPEINPPAPSRSPGMEWLDDPTPFLAPFRVGDMYPLQHSFYGFQCPQCERLGVEAGDRSHSWIECANGHRWHVRDLNLARPFLRPVDNSMTFERPGTNRFRDVYLRGGVVPND